MPSSLIFAGLVVLWLLILVPAVARRRQEVARLSPAVLSGRVLERPTRHRLPEVDMTERRDDGGATTVGELADRREDVPSPRGARRDDWDRTEIDDDGEVGDRGDDRGDHVDHGREDDRYEIDDYDHADDSDDSDDSDDHRDADREPTRYRPGRGGFDPEAAAAAAHAKYAFRQRLVLALLVLLLAAGALALLVSTTFWWAAAALGAGLGGYLTYLRRQVRIEESIRARRAARLTAPRRAAVVDEYEEDAEYSGGSVGSDSEERDGAGHPVDGTVDEDETDEDWTADDGRDDRVRGTGEPVGVLPARCRTVDGGPDTEHTSSLPRVTAAAIPPIPAGTSLVDVDDEEELDGLPGAVEHRRAVGE